MRQVIWHEPLLAPPARAAARAAAAALAADYGARLLVDARCADDVDAGASAAAGLFLGVAQLRRATQRPPAPFLGAAVRTGRDLALAAALGCDCAVLAVADGQGVAEAARGCGDSPLPLYLPGDGGLDQLVRAQRLGAQGLAVAFTS